MSGPTKGTMAPVSTETRNGPLKSRQDESDVSWCSDHVFNHDHALHQGRLVMVGWKCQNPDCGEVLSDRTSRTRATVVVILCWRRR